MPATKSVDDQIRTRITEFVEEISALAKSAAVEAVRGVLENGAPSTAARPARRAGKPQAQTAASAPAKSSGKKGKRIRRSSSEVEALAAAVQSHVASNPGQRLGEIASALGVETKDARRPAFSLVEEGVLRTEGLRGGTRYYPAGGGSSSRRPGATKKAKRKKRSSKTGRGKKSARKTAAAS